MTDTDALHGRMAQTVWEVCTEPFTPTISAASANEVAIALAPIVAEEVRKAKAEAWDEGQHDLYLYYQSEGLAGSEGRNPYSDTETGDSDEHR